MTSSDAAIGNRSHAAVPTRLDLTNDEAQELPVIQRIPQIVCEISEGRLLQAGLGSWARATAVGSGAHRSGCVVIRCMAALSTHSEPWGYAPGWLRMTCCQAPPNHGAKHAFSERTRHGGPTAPLSYEPAPNSSTARRIRFIDDNLGYV
jgi:hypothetical protein